MDRHTTEHAPALGPAERVPILLAEYQALYALAEFRMSSLDRRVPTAGAALLASVGSIPAVPPETGAILFAAIPASLIWLLRTTINHARSFEDLIRRIECLERRLNEVAGDALIGFQSTHPSRGKAVGGRTGVETVLAVTLASMIVLGSCAFLLFQRQPVLDDIGAGALAYLGVIAIYLLLLVRDCRRYRYPLTTGQKV